MTVLGMDHRALLIKSCKVEPKCMQFAPPVPIIPYYPKVSWVLPIIACNLTIRIRITLTARMNLFFFFFFFCFHSLPLSIFTCSNKLICSCQLSTSVITLFKPSSTKIIRSLNNLSLSHSLNYNTSRQTSTFLHQSKCITHSFSLH